MPKKDWNPRDVVALVLALAFVLFVLATAAVKLVLQTNGVSDAAILAWKEILLALVGGLLVWIGAGKDEK